MSIVAPKGLQVLHNTPPEEVHEVSLERCCCPARRLHRSIACQGGGAAAAHAGLKPAHTLLRLAPCPAYRSMRRAC